ncbi:heterokaryon incompatibility (het-6OR allele) [Fusarium beomiforme]|uniref:Heterokaryon incompatibility (Het-6OR allele) n=1 Tax=Fusarium beomiforme TaxID=44412 RepID=A0A9P5AJH7_9HYPO|nr:heterokaryon incompatibility (het-6OR allele) [Fusarium beomiforme]
MTSTIKTCSAERKDAIQVHDHCPEQAYVELEVPQDAKRVTAVTFGGISRDQGWADKSEAVSFTWWDASVKRPEGRGDLRTITVLNNRLANEEPQNWSERWTVFHGPRRRLWIEALRPGDIIQLIPRATYMAWVNIIDEGRIGIEYEPKDISEELQALQIASNAAHYSEVLNVERQDIRLLHVEPGTFDDPIRCHFQLASLKEVEPKGIDFHALSYCWGDPTEREEILLSSNKDFENEKEGVPFSIGKSAAQALRRLRQEKETLIIWIDAVCINQDDLEERAQQVTLMSQIYSLASTVHIWLGEDNHGVEACLKLIRDICNSNTGLCPGGEKCSCIGTAHSTPLDEIRAHEQSKRDEGHAISFKGMWEVFDLHLKTWTREIIDLAGWYNNTQLSFLMSTLYENPWFTRVWVIQEALSARRPYVHCSGEQVPWEEVVQVSNWLENPGYSSQSPHIASQQISMAAIWKTLKPKGRTTEVPSTPIEAQDTNELSSILEVFLSGLDLKATDPRDKLFALLTFANETHDTTQLDDLIRPNYDKSKERVFADFTRWWIREHNSVAILSFIHCQPSRTWVKILGPEAKNLAMNRPTWSVDSNGSARRAQANLNARFKFKAAGDTKPDLELLKTDDPLILRLSGLHITEIKSISHAPIEYMYPYHGSAEEKSELCQVFDKIFDPCALSPFWSNKHSIDDFWTESIENCNMKYLDHMRSHWNYVTREPLKVLRPTGNKELEYYKTNKLPTCMDPCFFVTTSGLFGLCPWRSKEGDVIVLLDGGNVPYLLRPVEGQKYELVGECFVQGIMHGEMLEALEKLGNGAGKRQVFDLV